MTDEARTAEAASPSGSAQRMGIRMYSFQSVTVSISVCVSTHVQFLFVSAREQSVISVPMQKQQKSQKCE